MSSPPSPLGPPSAHPTGGLGPEDQIILSGVTKHFTTMTWPALDHVDLAIERGSFLTVIGPSGAGKSTLLRALAGLVKPDSGHVSVFGEPPWEASRSKHLGWVPQSPALLPWRTVRENVRLPLQLNRRAPLRSPRPGGNPGPARPEPRARLVARTALGGDAPESRYRPRLRVRTQVAPHGRTVRGLDEMTREHVAHLLLELWQAERPTVVFVTHSVTEAVVLSDRVTVMGKGKLAQPLAIGLRAPVPEGIEDTAEFHRFARELRGQLREAFGASSS